MMKKSNYAPVECVNIPKMLFQEKEYENLSVDAKLLYSLLLDRKTVAMMNGWVDRYGTAYVIYPKSEMKKHLNASRYRVDMALNELEKCGQMVVVTQPNPGRPCQIYVKDITGNQVSEIEEDKAMCMMKDLNKKNEQMIRPCMGIPGMQGIAVVIDQDEFLKLLEALEDGMAEKEEEPEAVEDEDATEEKKDLYDFNSYKDEAYYALSRKEQRLMDMEVRGYLDEDGVPDEDEILADACDLGEEIGLNIRQLAESGWADAEQLFHYLYALHEEHKLNQLRAIFKMMTYMFGGSEEYLENMECCIGYPKNLFLSGVLTACSDVVMKMGKDKTQG
ncbi:MAG: replication initiator protein A [Eubacteriales bacterium]|nr:replication initiator protein A [Eubacteriales bacterium]